jgi:hypothetical protein
MLQNGKLDVVETEKDYEGGGFFIKRPDVPLPATPMGPGAGKKNDTEKPRLDLIPPSIIFAMGDILTSGAGIYGDRNWEAGMLWHRPYGALQRHLNAWWAGESLDKESGKSHLWHAAAELAFLIEYEAKGTGQDDRPGRDHGHCSR